MPLTIATVTVFALAIIPGAFGTYLWELFNGQDYHRKDWQAALRFIAFSVLGLAVYVFAALWLPLPPAVHVVPASYSDRAFSAASLPRLLWPYLGHIVGAGVVGLIAAGGHRLLCRFTGATVHPTAWDNFVRNSLPDRNVVVTLKSGDVFAGYVSTADQSAPAGERDIILRMPAIYKEEEKEYIGTSYRDMFLPAELVQNIATLRDGAEALKHPLPGKSFFGE